MNVRFFGGPKEEYLSIPKHNPLGLYFCADSRELFWGDRLLSDGIRLVHTKAELPEFNSAADGIIYYVVENRAGYVLSPDRAGWFPIFAAPTTDIGSVSESDAYNTAVSVLALRELEKAVYEKIASVETVSGVKTISFAGIELTKVDRAFSIDRETALKALGISITEGSEEATITELATKEYVDKLILDVPDVSNLATKDDIKDLVSVSYVDEKIAGIEHPSIPTKTSELENDSGFITSIPKEYITDEDLNAKGFITDQSLSDYAKRGELFSKSYNDLTDKPEIPSVAGLASEEYVNEQVSAIKIPEIPTNVSAFTNDAGYITDISGKADVNHTHEEYITEHQDISGKADVDHRHDDLYDTKGAAEAVKNELLNGAGEAYDTLKELGDLITDNVGAIEALEQVAASKADKEHTHDKYLTELPVHTHDEYLTELPEHTHDQYLTEHQDISGKVDMSALNDYFTKTQTQTEISMAITDAIADKADNIPFTDNRYIAKPVGGFVVGDNIKGWTITAILAKLLELSSMPIINENPGIYEPEIPEIPDEPQGVIATIIANQIPMYAITADAELAAIPFNHLVMTETEAAAPCAESGFYQIEDAEGNIIESGYQEIQVKNDEVYYMIALPKAVDYGTMIDIKVYNIKTNLWEPIGVKFDMVSDPTAVAALCEEVSVDISHIDQEQYTILVYEDIPTGSLLRYVIKE